MATRSKRTITKETTVEEETTVKKNTKPTTRQTKKLKQETPAIEELEQEKPATKKTTKTTKSTKAAKKEVEPSPLKKWESVDFECTKKNAKGQTYNLKICCWNIGGVRSWIKKECLEFLDYEKPDILCMQETKCNESKLPEEIKNLELYKQYWCPSKKDGYAGVGLLTKLTPINVTYGIEDEEMDEDGRCISAEFDNYFVVCVYVPNAGRKLVTLSKRLKWNESFKTFINNLNSKKPVIICGDMNVSHQEIDLARPQSNKKNAGFTQEERDGMSDFLGEGYVDTFRHLYPDITDAYTFWSYMANARSKNIGWRLDYFILSQGIADNVCDNVIRSQVLGSDHCPITLFLNI